MEHILSSPGGAISKLQQLIFLTPQTMGHFSQKGLLLALSVGAFREVFGKRAVFRQSEDQKLSSSTSPTSPAVISPTSKAPSTRLVEDIGGGPVLSPAQAIPYYHPVLEELTMLASDHALARGDAGPPLHEPTPTDEEMALVQRLRGEHPEFFRPVCEAETFPLPVPVDDATAPAWRDFYEENTALRFLSARRFHFGKTIEMMENNRQWRLSKKPFLLRPTHKVLSTGQLRLLGFAKDGLPVLFNANPEHGAPWLYEDNPDEFSDGILWFTEELIFLCRSRGLPVRFHHLYDLTNWERKLLKWRHITMPVFKVSADNYPECLATLWCVNVPRMFSWAWVIIKQLTDKRSRDKVNFIRIPRQGLPPTADVVSLAYLAYLMSQCFMSSLVERCVEDAQRMRQES